MPNFTCFVYDDGIVLRRVNRFWIVNFYGQYKIRIDSDKFKGLFNDEEAENMAVLIAIIKQKYQETQATTECKDDYLERISNAEINETLKKLLSEGYTAEELILTFLQIKWYEIVEIFKSDNPTFEVKQIKEICF